MRLNVRSGNISAAQLSDTSPSNHNACGVGIISTPSIIYDPSITCGHEHYVRPQYIGAPRCRETDTQKRALSLTCSDLSSGDITSVTKSGIGTITTWMRAARMKIFVIGTCLNFRAYRVSHVGCSRAAGVFSLEFLKL